MGPSVSLTPSPWAPRPGQLNSGDFHGVGTVHSLVGSKSVTVEGRTYATQLWALGQPHGGRK